MVIARLFCITRLLRVLAVLVMISVLTIGCTNRSPTFSEENRLSDSQNLDGASVNKAATITDNQLHTDDGVGLTVRSWQSENPEIILIALHGMNDYGHAFSQAGQYWAQNAITTYAYDQRGFGELSPTETSIVKKWPGTRAYGNDLRNMVTATRARHPGVPLYVLGHSMGAAVVMTANADEPLKADGLILAAPAIWGGNRMPLFYRLSLSLANTFAPGKTLSGKRAKRQATDNIPVLRAMQADPLVIKETPIRDIKGIVSLMGDANSAAKNQSGNIFFIYGCKDEIIPIGAMGKVADQIETENPHIKREVYANGWHLLFRDLEAKTVWMDVAAWMKQSVSSPDLALRNSGQRVSGLPACET